MSEDAWLDMMVKRARNMVEVGLRENGMSLPEQCCIYKQQLQDINRSRLARVSADGCRTIETGTGSDASDVQVWMMLTIALIYVLKYVPEDENNGVAFVEMSFTPY